MIHSPHCGPCSKRLLSQWHGAKLPLGGFWPQGCDEPGKNKRHTAPGRENDGFAVISSRSPQRDTQILIYGETDKRKKNFRRDANSTQNKSHKKPACQSDILLVPYQQALKEFPPQATESTSTLWIIALFGRLHYLFIHSCIIYPFSFIIWPCEE